MITQSEFLKNAIELWSLKGVMLDEIKTFSNGMSSEKLKKSWEEIKMLERKPTLAELIKIIGKEKNQHIEKSNIPDEEPDFDYAYKFMKENDIYRRDYTEELKGYIFRRAVGEARKQIEKGILPNIVFNGNFIEKCLNDQQKIYEKRKNFKKNPYNNLNFDNSAGAIAEYTSATGKQLEDINNETKI